MTRTRSPNYPYIGLPAAIERVRKVYDKEHQGRMSKLVVAKHLGFGGLNGISVSVISALGKYGLLANIGDELQVSDDALTILVDPPDSEDHAQALRRAALKPELFTELHKHFGGTIPSDVNLLAYLQKHGFTANAAALAAKSFRETMQLISGQTRASHDMVGKSPEGVGTPAGKPFEPPKPPSAIKLMASERELTTGLLSKNASFRLIVSGDIGVREIERLIAKLQLDKEILAEPESGPASAEPKNPTEPTRSAESANQARVSFFIPESLKPQLRAKGYTDDQIANMKPAQAHKILGITP
jgi:hypothetical protein